MSRRRFLITIGTGLALAGPVGAIAQGVKLRPGSGDALVVVDMQNCFVPGGTLPVAGGDQIVPLVNRLARAFENVVSRFTSGTIWSPPATGSVPPGTKQFCMSRAVRCPSQAATRSSRS